MGWLMNWFIDCMPAHFGDLMYQSNLLSCPETWFSQQSRTTQCTWGGDKQTNPQDMCCKPVSHITRKSLLQQPDDQDQSRSLWVRENKSAQDLYTYCWWAARLQLEDTVYSELKRKPVFLFSLYDYQASPLCSLCSLFFQLYKHSTGSDL